MDNQIAYTTVKEQIELLKSKGLLFEDETDAAEKLNMYGYYNIINSYKSPYQFEENGTKTYSPGTTFEQIFSLFIFDHNLRNSVIAAMLDLEQHVKAATSEVIAEAFGTDQNDYLQWKNYRDRHTTRKCFGLNEILNTLQNTLMSGKDPIKYYRNTYGTVPPWILFRGIYFSTTINFSRLFKNAQKTSLVQKLYDCPEKLCSLENTKNLLFDALYVCLEYRNLAAHGGRIYNYDASYKINHTYDSSLDVINADLVELPVKSGISKFLILLDTFKYKQPFMTVANAITIELNRHLARYPDDYKILAKAIGIRIFAPSQEVILLNGQEYPFTAIRESDSDVVFMPDLPEELKKRFGIN